jgi:glutamyl-tRNA reductase
MTMLLFGCNHHRASIAIREQLAFSPRQAESALGELREAFPQTEAVLLSTCNRVELYAGTENGPGPTRRQVAEFLGRFHDLDPDDVVEHLFEQGGREAIRHLFLVASSLDSMVVGEPQILSQVRRAYGMAVQQRATGPLVHMAFQTALKVARRVATETSIHRRRLSIPSVAVAEFAKRIFERFDDKRTLVIGAGEMAEETLKYLHDEGARDVTVVNRCPQRAADLAQRWDGRAVEWDRLPEALAGADLVLSTTGAEEPIVALPQFKEIERQRGRRPLFVLDLAVPRDFDPAIGQRPNVYLYSIDDLQRVCQQNSRLRENELPSAIQIVDRETDRFIADQHHRAIGPMIKRLQQSWHAPKKDELQRLLNKLPELDDRSRDEIGRSFDRLINKLLHPPMESLRQESSSQDSSGFHESVARLFQLENN